MNNNNMHHNDKYNRLKDEKSPYLLQHSQNPVDWFPWENEAFNRAKREDKPIFLSIGYSTCHWCHVMEKESFENDSVAELLNESFISVKVDREERPDIDNIYMAVCQAINGRGGWPLTIVMTPDRKPFYAATYIPRESRYGVPGMIELLPAISLLWKTKRHELLDSAESIINAVSEKNREENKNIRPVNKELLRKTFDQLYSIFDEEYAGFGRAPKFPTVHNLTFLLRYWRRTGNAVALEMVERTLEAMRMGGIYDHIGHGVHRYSTDRHWLLPHFEKMLYDQAMMVITLTEAYQATANLEYKTTAEEILSYLERDMTSSEGGFYSAEDADSEGVEGKFYVWTTAEIEEILGKEHAEIFMKIFNVKKEGNFAEEHSNDLTGKNILHTTESMQNIRIWNGEYGDYILQSIEKSREKLFAEREKRIHPSKDDKILTDWNGLTIAAFCKAAQAFDNEDHMKTAMKTANFFMENMTDNEGKMKHRYRDGEVAVDAFLEDYAFFIWGLIELYQTTFDIKYLEHALKLNDYLIAHFHDNENGGFFHTSDEAEEMIFRSKEVYDGAIPSGNSVSAMNLLRLAKITGNPELEELADRTLRVFAEKVKSAPAGYTQFMSAVDLALNGSVEIVIAGEKNDSDTTEIVSFINERFIPEKVVVLKDINSSDRISKIAPFTKDMVMSDNKTTIHLCQDHNCKLPSNDIEKIKELIEALSHI
ncbi:thioredoxin domain-containing protein [Methanolobus sediminis]|uniref:Thioredoxin domain-containing protein n=1 Tax=Methanolobus sediminis TaxID=3072978 RepID=A0AA51UJ55_9EURY|nr:thioredoxin domain-containing protein [Methanolobus sediminis]WMW24502.1 thioredoxin domain-containing protein [Methanolobus sediminis]